MVYWEAEPGGLEKNASVSPNLRCYQKKGLGILGSRAREQGQEGWRKCVSYPSSSWVPGVLRGLLESQVSWAWFSSFF